MTSLTKAFRKLSAIFSYMFLSIVLISCSNDEDLEHNKFDHSHSETIDIEKHLFEHEFAQQCVTNNTAKLVNKDVGQEDFAKYCMCIATFLFKDLATKESYSLLNNKKHAQLLRNKYKEAINHCL